MADNQSAQGKIEQLAWEPEALKKYHLMIEKVPIFLRGMAKDKVDKELLKITQAADFKQLTEKELIDAFFAATPFGFHGPMKCDMEEFGLDYQKYGYER